MGSRFTNEPANDRLRFLDNPNSYPVEISERYPVTLEPPRQPDCLSATRPRAQASDRLYGLSRRREVLEPAEREWIRALAGGARRLMPVRRSSSFHAPDGDDGRFALRL